MNKLTKPNREPDYILDLEYGAWFAFWFEEKIQSNDFGAVFKFDIDTLKFKVGDSWYKYILTPQQKSTLRDAYVNSLLEKGLL